QIPRSEHHEAPAVATSIAKLVDGRGPRRWATATKTDFARHRHAEHAATTWSLCLGLADADFGDCSIKFGIVLANRGQDFHRLQPMAQSDLTTMAKRRFEITIERDT